MLNESKCLYCKYRFSRIIEPITQEDIDYYSSFLDIEDLDDNYELQIEHHRCLMTDEDLDGVIIKCNHFEPVSNMKLIREYKF